MRWLVENEDKTLSIVVSSAQPPNAICEARSDWDAMTLSYNKDSGLVFIDPDKVRNLREADAKLKVLLNKQQRKDMLLRVSPMVIYIVIAFALGFFIGHI